MVLEAERQANMALHNQIQALEEQLQAAAKERENWAFEREALLDDVVRLEQSSKQGGSEPEKEVAQLRMERGKMEEEMQMMRQVWALFQNIWWLWFFLGGGGVIVFHGCRVYGPPLRSLLTLTSFVRLLPTLTGGKSVLALMLMLEMIKARQSMWKNPLLTASTLHMKHTSGQDEMGSVLLRACKPHFAWCCVVECRLH